MLTIAPLKRWSINYYNDTARAAMSAATDARRRANGGLGEYYSEGETRAPVWMIAGDVAAAADLAGLSAADRVGGEADVDVVARWLDDGIARNGACGLAFSRRDNHGYDLTFGAPKSVSLLRALGDDVTGKAVAEAHTTAIGEALEYLHQHAGYTRVHNPDTGLKDLVRLPGLITVAYQHETSRAGDPHLHTHVIVPNKQPRADGKLVSIDSKSVHYEAKAAGAIYQATLRRELHRSLGVEWAAVDPRTGMAELAGVDRHTINQWSQRATALREWAARNLVIDGEGGPTRTQLATAQKATRPAKPERLAWAELRRLWRDDHRGFAIDDAAQAAARAERSAATPDALAAARAAAADIDKPAFTRANLVAAIAARMPILDDVAPGTVRTQVEALADHVGMRITAAREAHQREGHERYTAAPIIAEEAALLGLMSARDERVVIPEHAINTERLSPDQARAITNIAVSPWLIQPLSAPAGAGKTTSLRALRAAAQKAGKRRVVVLAPTGKAVDVAVREGAGDAGYTLAKALSELRSGALTFDTDSVVVVDEAGMVGTPELLQLLTATTQSGVKTVLVGDAHQLAPVNARGGMFEQLCTDLPWAQRLSAVWRMTGPEERSASLALRDGGPAALRRAITWYRQHHRLHTGDPVAMAADALARWRADTTAGKDALLIADSWEMCDALNTRIHGENIDPAAPTVTAARGHRIAAGDVIISRRNDPSVVVLHATRNEPASDPVRNGNRWRVYAVDSRHNRIAARRIGDGARAAFSEKYLREHIHHGYALTVHAAQGTTADTTQAVLGESTNRAAAYVALTRGREHNSAYLYERIAGETEHEHPETTTGVHAARRGSGREAATLLCTILGRDQRAQTVIATAADTDRTQLPQQVTALLRRHERTRGTVRAAHRSWIDHHTAHPGYDLDADLPQLRAEVEFLAAAAGARSPAAMYTASEDALSGLDDPSRSAVITITTSAQAIHVLRLQADADKTTVLRAVAVAVHDHSEERNRSLRIAALPATGEAHAYASANRYAHLTSRPSIGRDNFDTGRWKLPLGSLVIVDDADHLGADHLGYLTGHAARTNTKLLLLTTPEPGRKPAHSLVNVLVENLPWAQQLGTPAQTRHQATPTALHRAERHLAVTSNTRAAYAEAAQLLQRRDQLRAHYDYLTTDPTPSREHTRDRHRSRGRDHGIEL